MRPETGAIVSLGMIILVYGAAGAYLCLRYARQCGRASLIQALIWIYFGGGPREGRRLRLLIWLWIVFGAAVYLAVALTMLRARS